MQILSAHWLVECPPAKLLCFTVFYNQMWSVVSVNGQDLTYGEEKLYCIGSEPGHSLRKYLVDLISDKQCVSN